MRVSKSHANVYGVLMRVRVYKLVKWAAVWLSYLCMSFIPEATAKPVTEDDWISCRCLWPFRMRCSINRMFFVLIPRCFSISLLAKDFRSWRMQVSLALMSLRTLLLRHKQHAWWSGVICTHGPDGRPKGYDEAHLYRPSTSLCSPESRAISPFGSLSLLLGAVRSGTIWIISLVGSTLEL